MSSNKNKIKLDKITKENKKDLFNIVSNLNVMKFVGSREVWSEKKTNNFINYCVKEENTNNKDTLFLKIVYKKSNKFIGIVGIHKRNYKKDEDFEVTYYLNKKEQGKGFGTMALGLLLDKFHNIHPIIKKVYSDTLSNNIGGQKSLIKSGFMFLKKIKRSGREYFRYIYKFKFHKILSVKYPYLKYFLKKKEVKERFVEMKRLKFNQLLGKEFTDKLLINIDYSKDAKYNRVTDYFTNPCRMKCVFKGNVSPLEYYTKNKGEVLKNSLIKNKFDYDKFEQYMYDNSDMCNNFQVSITLNIFNYFKPTKILDSSAGWGDRLLSSIAYSQMNNSKVSYIGFDPSTCLKPLYKKIIKEMATKEEQEKGLFKVITKPFEKATKKDLKGDYDLAFTSPPFWDLEVYENHENQSIFGFKTEDEWVRGFLNKLADININNLIVGGYFVIYVLEYKEFMKYMKERRDVEYQGDILFKSGEKGKERKIFVWKKIK